MFRDLPNRTSEKWWVPNRYPLYILRSSQNTACQSTAHLFEFEFYIGACQLMQERLTNLLLSHQEIEHVCVRS